ncbi:S8 family serine peptidase [Paenibacillus chondroitinus]|uniref:S8 family serine peptidase n=1 Tax=Paenibacillus chondroitinus TaxID=59842 RepID=A0ABU6DBD2_9BACL|nr:MULTISPECIES: S8 family serine peptidase [Paenibacillus]MCY9660463.1 S8 family serine peptidase [Paenibacillus anseongense]MEB4795074.1 S8 family serine peptidase [Paenibacillus chondroitinus]
MKFIRHLGFIVLMILVVELTVMVTKTEAAYPVSTDPMRVKQTYLDMIHINEAWAAAGDSRASIVVAVVDTGVDLTHPDLVGNLVEGVNLLQPSKKPIDDNGHGTNVAGIIAASINNDKGIAGIAPMAKIMPIKALESDGTGGEAKLGEGIKYAVDHGAKIVVLSLGLNKYSDYMEGVVKYAEDHNVLLVAAVGNESMSVKYPAAYPTVLAVGGVTADKQADPRSNFGPELDLVAPWDVYTTALGGGYQYQDGSSMSAPQVAGAAALVWSKYPTMSAYEVRAQLEQTADDLAETGWDAKTGYGLLRVDMALTKPYKEDRFEPNDRQSQAAKLPIHTSVKAALSSALDEDWYAIDAAYDGYIELWVQNTDSAGIRVRFDSGETFISNSSSDGTQPFKVKVTKGRTYVQLQTVDRERKTGISYSLQTDFIIYTDPFEDNDKQYKAFALPERSQTIRGTFHQKGDVDWFVLPLEHSGSIRLKLSVDTGRIDPMILFQKEGEKSITIDQGGDGGIEISSLMDVFPGQYYIRVSNTKDYTEPITGEYTLEIEYTPKLIDPNEPNDKSYQATFAAMNSVYEGLFNNNDDVDWFEFRMSQNGLAQIRLTNIPTSRTMYATLYDSTLKEQGFYRNEYGSDQLFVEKTLNAGTYYIKLQANQWFMSQMYRLKIGSYTLVSGFADIEGHWAQDAISKLTEQGVISGYGNYRFAPNQSITRAEAATVLTRALKLTKRKELKFSDMPNTHWAYDYVAKALQADIVAGYPDGTFGPDRTLTRMEMTQMLARSMNMTGKKRGNSPFNDVDESYWGLGILKQMWADGWITGYSDGSFHPDEQATRAEFVSMLVKVMNR